MSEKERWVVALAKGHLNQLKGVFYEEGLACVECERSASSTVRLCGFSAKATERDPSPSFWDDLTRNLTWHSRVAEAQKRNASNRNCASLVRSSGRSFPRRPLNSTAGS